MINVKSAGQSLLYKKMKQQDAKNSDDSDLSMTYFDDNQKLRGDAKIDITDLSNIENIRKVTRGQFKELSQFVDDRKGRIPLFGFPMISYSPPNEFLAEDPMHLWNQNFIIVDDKDQTNYMNLKRFPPGLHARNYRKSFNAHK